MKSRAVGQGHVGIGVAHTDHVALKPAAALVLLVTIAGTPVTTLACIGRCVPDAVPASAACHHAMNASVAVGAKDADDSCVRLFASSPFVKEESQLTALAALTASAPPAPLVAAPGEALLASVRDVVIAVPHRSISSLVLRL